METQKTKETTSILPVFSRILERLIYNKKAVGDDDNYVNIALSVYDEIKFPFQK